MSVDRLLLQDASFLLTQDGSKLLLQSSTAGGTIVVPVSLLFDLFNGGPGMFKNVASQKLTVFAYDATTGLPKTGDAANLTAYVDKDDGGVTVLGDTSATEKDSTNAKGYYIFDLTQDETNADKLMFSAKSSTANIVVVAVPAVVYTLPTTGILAPATAGRTLAVDASGNAPATIAAGAIANDAITAAAVADGAIDAGAIATGAITNAKFAAGAIDAAAIATDAIDDDALKADAVTAIQNGLATSSALSALSAIFTGITSLAQWLGLLAGKQTGNSTARTELRATGDGSGTFDEATDSQEALRDRGDAAWVTATGFSTHTPANVRTEMDANSTKLANLDATVGSRLASASYTAPDNASITAIKAKTDNLPASPAATGAAMTLTSAYDAAKTAAQAGDAMALTTSERDSVAAALLDLANGTETGETMRQTLRLLRAGIVGKSDSFPAGPVHFRDRADAKNRITATVDADGNRSAVTTDVS